jgi:hypothetical protein
MYYGAFECELGDTGLKGGSPRRGRASSPFRPRTERAVKHELQQGANSAP